VPGPRLYRAIKYAFLPVRYYQIRVKFDLDPKAIARRAGAKGRVERKRAGLYLAKADAAVRAGILL
jgi:hypothetical protein